MSTPQPGPSTLSILKPTSAYDENKDADAQFFPSEQAPNEGSVPAQPDENDPQEDE